MLLLDIKRKNGSLNVMHFVGIGGIGMSGIAELMHNLGYKVQGSDLQPNNNTKRLEKLGIHVFIGHHESNIQKASYIVISTAVKPNNPEIVAASAGKIPVIRRSEMLAELMRLKCSVSISGSHGKTTTTSLTACLFEAADLDPTVINGGIINNRSTNAYLGKSDYLIAEADESDATFIKIPSTIAVITNIDPEHMDYYKNFETLTNAFKSFISNLPFYGFAVACVDHPVVREIVDEITERRVITYGIESEDANIIAYNIKSNIDSSIFDIKIKLPNSSEVTLIENIILPTAGRHNVLNSLAAIAIGVELGFGAKIIQNGFKNFQGVKRRFTKICKYNEAEIIDDYAHHPVEIQATLSTARLIADKQKGRVIAVFQPHRYSRLHSLFADFASAFSDADKIYVTDVYSAGEESIDGISGNNLALALVKNKKDAKFVDNIDSMIDIVKLDSKKGDIILFMGAGSISSWVNELPQKLVIEQ